MNWLNTRMVMFGSGTLSGEDCLLRSVGITSEVHSPPNDQVYLLHSDRPIFEKRKTDVRVLLVRFNRVFKKQR